MQDFVVCAPLRSLSVSLNRAEAGQMIMIVIQKWKGAYQSHPHTVRLLLCGFQVLGRGQR